MYYTVHGILQAGILERVAFVFSRDIPKPGTEPRSPILQVDSLPAESQGKPKNTGVGSLSLLQAIFPMQELNQGLLHCGWILYQLSYEGNPKPHWCAAVHGVTQSRIRLSDWTERKPHCTLYKEGWSWIIICPNHSFILQSFNLVSLNCKPRWVRNQVCPFIGVSQGPSTMQHISGQLRGSPNHFTLPINSLDNEGPCAQTHDSHNPSKKDSVSLN